jgi:hypothetical protein
MIEAPARDASKDRSTVPAGVDEEALFREARRLRRRRWATRLLITGVLGGAVALVVVLLTGSAGHTAPSVAAGRDRAGRPVGQVVGLKLAGPMAVAPNGRLYVADLGSDRVLVRLADGRFRVVAGDGRRG